MAPARLSAGDARDTPAQVAEHFLGRRARCHHPQPAALPAAFFWPRETGGGGVSRKSPRGEMSVIVVPALFALNLDMAAG
jgi:hypothetical protein